MLTSILRGRLRSEQIDETTSGAKPSARAHRQEPGQRRLRTGVPPSLAPRHHPFKDEADFTTHTTNQHIDQDSLPSAVWNHAQSGDPSAMRLSLVALAALVSSSASYGLRPTPLPSRAAVCMSIGVGDVVPPATRQELGVTNGRAVVFSVTSDTDRRCGHGARNCTPPLRTDARDSQYAAPRCAGAGKRSAPLPSARLLCEIAAAPTASPCCPRALRRHGRAWRPA
jgi:hypothetical protein